jgi:hypothetical protein
VRIDADGSVATRSGQATVHDGRRPRYTQELHLDATAFQHRCDGLRIPFDIWRIGGKIRNSEESGELTKDFLFVREAIDVDLFTNGAS